MFQKIRLRSRPFEDYLPHLPPGLADELQATASKLRDLRFVHVNSTSLGGGVAEILRSLVPMMRGLGLKADWYVLQPDQSYFGVTKHIHNLLQGQGGGLSPHEMDVYLGEAEAQAQYLNRHEAMGDVWFMHDPQLLPLSQHVHWSEHERRLWICHIDLSTPNPSTLEALLPLAHHHDGMVFSLESYAPPGTNGVPVHIIPPGIDPLTVKNRAFSRPRAQRIVAGLGVDLRRPMVAQVSRFDMWKDPWGVIDAYRIARDSVEGLQLVYLGIVQARDDPEAAEMIRSVQDHAKGDPDIHLVHDEDTLPAPVDQVVNAVQVAARVMLQKSTREGFGLSATEAMWKGTPLIAGNVGGLKHQVVHGESGYLVNSSEEAGSYLTELLRDPELASHMGAQAKERVRQQFLLPRLLLDYLKAAEVSLETRPVVAVRGSEVEHFSLAADGGG